MSPVRNSEFVNIPDDFQGYSKRLFCIPNHYVDSISNVLIPHGVIQERIKKMARNILKDVLKEKEKAPDPTNICSSTDSAAASLFTKREEVEAIQDLINTQNQGEDNTFSELMALANDEEYEDVKVTMTPDPLGDSFAFSPMDCIDSFNSALDMEFLGPAENGDIDSYKLDLDDILEPDTRTYEVQPNTIRVTHNDPMLGFNDMSPRLNTIAIKSFAKASIVPRKKESIHFLCILKGQTPFMEVLKRINCPSVKGGYKFFLDLLDHVNKLNSGRDRTSVQVALDFIRLDAVGSGVNVQGIEDLSVLRGSNIVIVEDIVDTGRTMAKLISRLEEHCPKRILIACLLRKRCRVPCYTPDYIGFEVPNKFMVGYALDLNEYFRDLLHICLLSQAGLDKYGN